MNSRPRLNLRLTLSATLLGNTLEWYDYITYGFLVPVYSVVFFSAESHRLALFLALMIYAIGSFARPLGGILFGFIGDRWGRKTALISSVFLMTLPVIVISIMPSYAQIGVAAAYLLSAMRFLQGISAGGEYSGISVFLIESSPIRERGYFGSFVYLGVVFGLLIGAIDYMFLTMEIGTAALYEWGWRIPGIIGGFIGCTAFYLRRYLHETPLYHRCQSLKEVKLFPLAAIFMRHKRALLQIFGITVLETIAFNLLIIFSLTYLTHTLKMPFKIAMMLNLFQLFILGICLPIAGKLASRYGSRKVAFYAALGFLLFSYPLFALITIPSLFAQCIGLCGLAFLLAAYCAPMPLLCCDLFPTSVRYSGIAFGYNATIAIIGGTAPLFTFYLIERFRMANAPAFCIMGAALISALVLMNMKNQRFYLE